MLSKHGCLPAAGQGNATSIAELKFRNRVHRAHAALLLGERARGYDRDLLWPDTPDTVHVLFLFFTSLPPLALDK